MKISNIKENLGGVFVSGVNILVDTKYYSSSAIENMRISRNNSVLRPEEFAKKVESGEVVCLNPDAKRNKKIFLYVADNESEMSKIQFYNEYGFMFSYPWNGDIAYKNVLNVKDLKFKTLYEMVNSRRTSFCYWKGRQQISSLEISVTDKDEIKIVDYSKVKNSKGLNECEKNISLYQINGKENLEDSSIFKPKLVDINSNTPVFAK